MSSAKDRRLMKELLKYPATVFFKDKYITVFQTNDPKSFIHYSQGIRTISHHEHEQQWIVRGYRGDIIVLRHELFDDFIRIIGHKPADGNRIGSDIGLTYYQHLYPSLFDAFEELAEKINCLPFIRNQTEEQIMAAIKENPRHVQSVRKMTKKLMKKLIREFDGSVVPHIQPQYWTSDIAHYIIDIHGGDMLHYVPDNLRSPQLCLKAVRDYPLSIRDCPMQTDELAMVAAKKDGRSLSYIKKPTFAVKKAAVKSHPDAWLCIKDEKERKKLKKAK